VSSFVPLFGPEEAGGGLWPGGELADPPYKAEIDDRWMPEGDPHCYALTPSGWVVDLDAERTLWSLSSPDGA
jgi:hypothetical protein